jgi:energy-coupling factor transporter ATP-binding protein EcfA2
VVVGIRGESGAGKSTLAAMLCYALNNPHGDLFGFMEFMKEYEHGFVKGKWRTANFASTLKIAMATMYGIDYKQYEDGKFKDTKIGKTVWYLNVVLQVVKGEPILLPITSRNSEEEIVAIFNEIYPNLMDDVELKVTSKEITWRDTLNEGANGMHLYLGPDIALQAYEHRFDSPTEHLIMGDVRKPSEIDLIKKNNGVIIWLNRNFIFEASHAEVTNFFDQKGYYYIFDESGKAEKSTSASDLYYAGELGIKVGIDVKPKKNIADDWLAGDDRHDFIFYNPLNNPLYRAAAYTTMFEHVMAATPVILDKLLKHD